MQKFEDARNSSWHMEKFWLYVYYVKNIFLMHELRAFHLQGLSSSHSGQKWKLFAYGTLFFFL